MGDYITKNLPLSNTGTGSSTDIEENITNVETLPPDSKKIVDEDGGIPAFTGIQKKAEDDSVTINDIPYIESKRVIVRRLTLKKRDAVANVYDIYS